LLGPKQARVSDAVPTTSEGSRTSIHRNTQLCESRDARHVANSLCCARAITHAYIAEYIRALTYIGAARARCALTPTRRA